PLSGGLSSRIMVDSSPIEDQTSPVRRVGGQHQNKGGSILEVLNDMIKVGQAMGVSP
ncbi:hypothetical protein Tco_0609767, partial [Tanacetum coccineum]